MKKKIWKKSILSSNENSFLIKNAMKNEGKNLINSKLCILNKLVLYDFIEKRIPVKVLEVSNRKTRPSYLPCTAWGPEQTAPTAQCDFCDYSSVWFRRLIAYCMDPEIKDQATSTLFLSPVYSYVWFMPFIAHWNMKSET